jgi:hypothetical protein
LNTRRGGPQNWYVRCEAEKNLAPAGTRTQRSASQPVPSGHTYRQLYPGSELQNEPYINTIGKCGLDGSGSCTGTVNGSCDYGKDTSDHVKCREALEELTTRSLGRSIEVRGNI